MRSMNNDPYQPPSSNLERSDTSPPRRSWIFRKPYLLYVSTTGIWVIAVSLHAWWHIHSVLAGPPLIDTYAQSATFQAFAFALVCLPLWVLALAAILVTEVILVRRQPLVDEREAN
jgi:hypothetical protein